MGKRIELRGKKANAAAVIVLGIAVFYFLQFVPGVPSLLGLSQSYGIGIFRTGKFHAEASPNAFVMYGGPRAKSSTIFARAGERIFVNFDVEIQRGRVLITIRDAPLWGDPVSRLTVASSQTGETTFEIAETGFYSIRTTYLFRFRGQADIQWQLE